MILRLLLAVTFPEKFLLLVRSEFRTLHHTPVSQIANEPLYCFPSKYQGTAKAFHKNQGQQIWGVSDSSEAGFIYFPLYRGRAVQQTPTMRSPLKLNPLILIQTHETDQSSRRELCCMHWNCSLTLREFLLFCYLLNSLQLSTTVLQSCKLSYPNSVNSTNMQVCACTGSSSYSFYQTGNVFHTEE